MNGTPSSFQTLWTAVDDFIVTRLIPKDPDLERALSASRSAGFPEIGVTAPQGKLLYLLARMIQASRILEIGTLGGYSTVWLAKALPTGGHIISLEVDPRRVSVSRRVLSRATRSGTFEIREGRAAESLSQLASESSPPFDFVFIDADKANLPLYLRMSLPLCRSGSVIVVDNLVRSGRILDADATKESTRGIRALYEEISKQPTLSATAIQTVGSKGHDGFAVALVR